ncbi:tautomerase family protein [Actinomycetospora sp. CA-101289]|uniref:tautomerase family protein n=1 Tax=Actinomycetospora sp. CA-101289 TaxID=3239893 RepID=UPI003D97558D
MPTYVVRARAETLIPGRRQRLAEQITEAHQRVTGAPRAFVQVVVEDLRGRDHFVDGRAAASGSVWVHGHVPAGWDEPTLAALAKGVREAVVATTGVVEDLVWVYLSEIPPERMIEATVPAVP